MAKEELLSVLNQIEKLARAALDILKSSDTGSRKRSRITASVKTSKTVKALPDRIVTLRDAGFFIRPQTSVEVHTKLKSTYSCDLDRVTMALIRLQRRKMLRKASKLVGKRKIPAYVW